jgi:hypothetical protein
MSVVNKYNNGKVYRIWSPSRTDLVYYGSTVNDLAKRLYHHKDKYKRHKEGKFHSLTSFNIFDQCSDYRIELVESFACNNRNELTAREGFYIRTNECVNKCIAGRTHKEWCQDNRDKRLKQMKQYNQAHKSEHKEQTKQYYQANKERLLAKARELSKLKKKNKE